MALQNIIAGPSNTAPAADYLQETITATPQKVIHVLDHGRYWLRAVTSLGGANAGPVTPSTPIIHRRRLVR